MIKNRLIKNQKKLKGWLKSQNIQAYRLYDKDIPEFPYVIDIYSDHIVVYSRKSKIDEDIKKQQNPQLLMAGIKEIFPDFTIVLKERQPQKGSDQYNRSLSNKERLVVQENQAKFWVNLYDYLDTGLFLDHRPLRQWIFKNAGGKEFLNLFCYTGSVSVFAALGGGLTTSVDMSKTYLNWAKENFTLNDLNTSNHSFIEENALTFLKKAPTYSKRYDIILLDPPTFSNSKKMEEVFEVEKDQDFLIKNCIKLLKPDGLLYFSNNKRNFKLSSPIREQYDVKNVTKASIPRDCSDSKIHHCYEIRNK